MSTFEGFELGDTYAKILRTVRELSAIRGVSRDHVLSAVMASETYRRHGITALHDMDLGQATAILRMLELWREKAQCKPPARRRKPSKAPPAPWQHATKEREKMNHSEVAP